MERGGGGRRIRGILFYSLSLRFSFFRSLSFFLILFFLLFLFSSFFSFFFFPFLIFCARLRCARIDRFRVDKTAISAHRETDSPPFPSLCPLQEAKRDNSATRESNGREKLSLGFLRRNRGNFISTNFADRSSPPPRSTAEEKKRKELDPRCVARVPTRRPSSPFRLFKKRTGSARNRFAESRPSVKILDLFPDRGRARRDATRNILRNFGCGDRTLYYSKVFHSAKNS